MPSIESQSLNLRMVSTTVSKETDMEYYEEELEDETMSDTDSYCSYGFLSTIWEETSLDLNSTDSNDVVGDADCPPAHPRRSRSLSPGPRSRSLSPEYSPGTNLWMKAFLTPKEEEIPKPPLEIVLDGAFDDAEAEPADTWEEPLDESCERLSLDRTSHHQITLVSLATGEQRTILESDDEFTFVSCTTEDLSINSEEIDDYESFISEGDDDISLDTYSERATTEAQQERQNEETTKTISQTPPPETAASPETDTTVDSTKAEYELSRSILEKILKLSRPQNSNLFVDPIRKKINFELSRRSIKESLEKRRDLENVLNLDPLKRKLSFALNRKNVEVAFVVVKRSLPRPEEAALMKLSRSGSNSNLFGTPPRENKNEKNLSLKYKLERYGGQRRQLNYQRSKNRLVKKMNKLKTRPRKITEDRPSEETLERFGGLLRRESFKKSKSLFEDSVRKSRNELLSPERRQRSLSPIPSEERRERIKDIFSELSKSDGNLKWMQESILEKDNKKETDVQTSRSAVVQRRRKLERFGGHRRRNTFKKSRKALEKKLKASKSHGQDCDEERPSKEDVERFGGLLRMESYRKSRELFSETFSSKRFGLNAKIM